MMAAGAPYSLWVNRRLKAPCRALKGRGRPADPVRTGRRDALRGCSPPRIPRRHSERKSRSPLWAAARLGDVGRNVDMILLCRCRVMHAAHAPTPRRLSSALIASIAASISSSDTRPEPLAHHFARRAVAAVLHRLLHEGFSALANGKALRITPRALNAGRGCAPCISPPRRRCRTRNARGARASGCRRCCCRRGRRAPARP